MRYSEHVRYIISLVVVVPTFTVACDGCGQPPDVDGGVDAGFTLSDVPLVINEAMSRNTSTIRDAQNEFDDWVEILNVGDEAIDVSGFKLTDSSNDGEFPAGASIAPGQHLIVFCDDTSPGTPEQPHFPFKLDGDNGEALTLFDKQGQLVDGFSFPGMPADVSYGRLPDGSGDVVILVDPSPGLANEEVFDAGPLPDAGCVTDTPIVINEVLAENVTTSVDEAGEPAPWIELYNTGAAPASLDGLVIDDDDDITDGAFVLPDEAIAVDGYALIYADREVGEGPLHTTDGVVLTSASSVVVLGNRCGDTLQTFALDGDGADVSICLSTNGDPESGLEICTPSPAAANP
jgi:hypothetical protein